MTSMAKLVAELMSLAHKSNQVVGENNSYYVTLEQLENAALATAPPEQAQCCCNVSWLDLDIGGDAPKWFQAGQKERVINYCADDVALERDLTNFVDNYGFVVNGKTGQVLRLEKALAAAP